MARIEQYDLPYGIIRRSAGLAIRGTRVAYACPVPDPIIGILRPGTGNTTEYILPPPASGSALMPHDVLWRRNQIFCSSLHGPVVQLDPKTGRAFYYDGAFQNPRLSSYHLAMDSKRRIWVSCYFVRNSSTGIQAGLARLIPSAQPKLRIWLLPDEFLYPQDLWVDELDRIYFSVRGTGVGSPAPNMAIGRLDQNGSELVGWKIMDTLDPRVHGIHGTHGSTEIWFSRNSPPGLYRFDTATNNAAVFTHPMVHGPQQVAIDDLGNPWFTDDDGFINMLPRQSTGAVPPLRDFYWSVEGHDVDAERIRVSSAQQPLYTAPLMATEEPEQILGPFHRWDLPGSGSSATRGLIERNGEIWFTDINRNRIGRLKA